MKKIIDKNGNSVNVSDQGTIHPVLYPKHYAKTTSCSCKTLNVGIINKSQNPLPEYAHIGDSGMDLLANEDGRLFAGQSAIIGTGLFVAIPEGNKIQIRSKSGLAEKHGLIPITGTIDSNYRGELKVVLLNTGRKSFDCVIGSKIAQMVLCPVIKMELKVVDKLYETTRGEAGFGSTGS